MGQLFSGIWETQIHICQSRGYSHMGQFCPPKNLTPLKLNLIHDLWYSFDRVQSPDHFGMSIFEIVKKLTELWPKYVCPYMGIWAILGLYWPQAPLFCNILDSNLFYMISSIKIHLVATCQSSSLSVPNFMYKTIIFLNKTGHNSVCTFCTIVITIKCSQVAFFNIFSCGFLH